MMESALIRMQRSAQAHREANPGHVVEEHHSGARSWRPAEAWWHCHTCTDNAKAREAV